MLKKEKNMTCIIFKIQQYIYNIAHILKTIFNYF